MIRNVCLRFACVGFVLISAALASSPAQADFFDDLRRTFQTDIPHFFQDDIPCAFGGHPTSGTKKSCRSLDHPAKPATDKAHRDGAAADRTVPQHEYGGGDAPPNAAR